MDLFSPVRLGWRVTTGAVDLAVGVVRGLASPLLGHDDEPAAPLSRRPPVRPPAPPTRVPTATPPVTAPEPEPEPEPLPPVTELLTDRKTVDDEPELVETEGGATAGPELHVDPPWQGYEQMTAADIVDRLVLADAAERAVVLLYEQQHKQRKSILAAATAA